MQMKRNYGVMAGVLAVLLLTGCSMNVSSQIGYESADAAKEALNTASVITVESNLEDADPAGDLLVDGLVAGYMENTGLVNIKWTVSVDDQDWFYIKLAPDESDIDAGDAVTGTTYGYYDMDDQCTGYAQERLMTPENAKKDYYYVFMDADGNLKDYYASEDGTVLYDQAGNVIATAGGEQDTIGADCTMTVAMKSGDAQSVDLADKLVMALNVFDELKDHYNTYH